MKILGLLVLAAMAALPAGSLPAGFEMWSGTQLKNMSKTLAPKINDQKLALQRLGEFGNHLVMVVHREGDGEAEVHEKQTDVFVVQSGRAALIVGGTVVNGRSIGPGEIRGASITGGEKKSLGPGDIVNIPPKVPHQVVLDGSKEFTYAIIKVNAE